MILVIGGLNGFIGSNVTEALVNLGYDCVVTKHSNSEVPPFLANHIGNRVVAEQADATSISDLRKLGDKHKIDGIVNVAGGFTISRGGPVQLVRGYFSMLDSVFTVAQEWNVKRVMFSSTLGVYFGLGGQLFTENDAISIQSFHPIIAVQKMVEIAASEFTKETGINTVCARLGGMFGPWQDPEAAGLPGRLIHAAAGGKEPDLTGVFAGNADDTQDFVYVKDLAKAIALLQTSERAKELTYNVGTGVMHSNAELVKAIQRVLPDFTVELPPGNWPGPPLPQMDVKNLQRDTDFSPQYDLESATRSYLDWLTSGNKR